MLLSEINGYAYAGLLSVLYAVAAFGLALLALSVYWNKVKKVLLFFVSAAAVNVIVLTFLTMVKHDLFGPDFIHQGSATVKRLEQLPLWTVICFIFIQILILLTEYYILQRLRNNSITPFSVKEGMDNLPSALCFAKQNGLPLLVNKTMNSICYELSGSTVMNGNMLWNLLKNKYITLNNGEVWQFSREYVELEGETVYQIIGIPVTELNNLKEKLQNENKRLHALNRRLVEYGRQVEKLTREEEILNAKIRIHGEIGSALVATKFYIQKNEGNCKEVIKLWQTISSLLNRETQQLDDNENEFEQLKAAASAIGVKIVLIGALPQSRAVQKLFITAAKEALTNAVRHAEADTLTVVAEEKRFSFTNNGKLPNAEITEHGGLLSLREKIENAGGNMCIQSKPVFELKIALPKEA